MGAFFYCFCITFFCFFSAYFSSSLFSIRSRGELAARVFEKQADIELEREEWKEEVVKSKRRALEVT